MANPFGYYGCTMLPAVTITHDDAIDVIQSGLELLRGIDVGNTVYMRSQRILGDDFCDAIIKEPVAAIRWATQFLEGL